MPFSLQIVLLLFISSCYPPENSHVQGSSGIHETLQNPVPALLTLADAEKILGEPCYLADSTTSREEGLTQMKLTYTAKEKDSLSGKTGNLYFMYEQFDQVKAARKIFTSIKEANQNHTGVKEIEGLGDEAYFHSDGQNFYFILVRKGKDLFRMKVNKVTDRASLDQFNLLAARIAASL